MLTLFVYIINSLTPSQTEKERDFSIEGIYTASRRDNISVEMIHDLIFINRNITALVCDTPIDVFGWSLYSVADIVNDTESNPDVFADSSDNE